MSATIIPSIIASDHDVTNGKHRLVANDRGLFERIFGIFRLEHFGWNVMGFSKNLDLLIESFSATMNPLRFFVKISNALKICGINCFIAMTCEHDCFHTFIVRQLESKVKCNLLIATKSTL